MADDRNRSRECEDCGETPAADVKVGWVRRTTCKHCGFKVCPWCFHHVHGRNHRAAKAGRM